MGRRFRRGGRCRLGGTGGRRRTGRPRLGCGIWSGSTRAVRAGGVRGGRRRWAGARVWRGSRGRPRRFGWCRRSSTYLVCAQDRGTPPHLQREYARRAGSVVELDAGHHPFLSRALAVRDLVLGL
ncbi:alpha/beta fold hydrolase [Streptomyces sp. NPDC048504]|uniref:alpha/beta fold hydrolase n=1 Tax=Streptomyces sp. NPDC048504 TaxID=3365559 RepID=UPI0037150DC1